MPASTSTTCTSAVRRRAATPRSWSWPRLPPCPARSPTRCGRPTGSPPSTSCPERLRRTGQNGVLRQGLRTPTPELALGGAEAVGLGGGGIHVAAVGRGAVVVRSEEHTSDLQSLMRISYAVFCLKKH